jgi:hypothetical protein
MIDPNKMTAAEDLLIWLQRLKTKMEQRSLQLQSWPAYWNLSQAIWSLEGATGLSAPSLRDAQDEGEQTP